MPSASTRIGTVSSLAASAVYRCQRQPGSSIATRRPPRLRSTCQSTVSAWEAAQQTTTCSGSTTTPRTRARYPASAFLSSGAPRWSA